MSLGPEGQMPAEDTAELGGSDSSIARRLFRYVNADEWSDYRTIISLFADTFFSEFSPDEIATLLADKGLELEPQVVSSRLEQLRLWGNLSVSSSVGSPSSVADYYKRRNRYLITPSGQEVHGLVEGVLARVDQVQDLSPGQLSSLRDALVELNKVDVQTCEPKLLAELVGRVFLPHEAFTSEITQFFAQINEWQARYDLDAEEFSFFAQVLSSYVGERLEEIQNTSRPIGHHLNQLQPKIPTIVIRMAGGLAALVATADLAESISVRKQAGSSQSDWDYLISWFLSTADKPSRIDHLGRDATAAIRTLTLNLVRLSRIGVSASSRRTDFLRLAKFFDEAQTSEDAQRIASAAYGLFPSVHLGTLSEDAADPLPTETSWWDAPRAAVPVSLRERADTTNRGATTPLRDRRGAAAHVRRLREDELAKGLAVDAELLQFGKLDNAVLTPQGLRRFQELLSRATHRPAGSDGIRRSADQRIVCLVESDPDTSTTVSDPSGSLTLRGLRVWVEPATSSATQGGG